MRYLEMRYVTKVYGEGLNEIHALSGQRFPRAAP